MPDADSGFARPHYWPWPIRYLLRSLVSSRSQADGYHHPRYQRETSRTHRAPPTRRDSRAARHGLKQPQHRQNFTGDVFAATFGIGARVQVLARKISPATVNALGQLVEFLRDQLRYFQR
jgi:hypothetical protein